MNTTSATTITLNIIQMHLYFPLSVPSIHIKLVLFVLVSNFIKRGTKMVKEATSPPFPPSKASPRGYQEFQRLL